MTFEERKQDELFGYEFDLIRLSPDFSLLGKAAFAQLSGLGFASISVVSAVVTPVPAFSKIVPILAAHERVPSAFWIHRHRRPFRSPLGKLELDQSSSAVGEKNA